MAKLYETFSGDDLKIAEKIQQRRYQMLVHSYIYYEMNENIISDSQWSKWAMELVDLQSQYPDIAKSVIYAKDFEGWDGSSGAFLEFANKPNIVSTARRLVQNKKPKKPSALFIPQPKKPAVKTNTAKKKLF